MKLVIFDMDQTLVQALSVHDAAACRVFRAFFGVDAGFSEVDCTGRSFEENFIQLGQKHGINVDMIKANLPEMLRAYDNAFTDLMPRNATDRILPGVLDLLEAMTRTDSLLVMYTGDSRAVARSVLDSTGLAGYFRKTFHATEALSRADMVRQAIQWGRGKTGAEFLGKDVVVIGDSVRDVQSGRAFGALTIGVSTGTHTMAQLAAENPDYVFRDLSNWQTVLTAIMRPG